MDHVKVRLFRVKQVKGTVNYKLKLLGDARVHLVFYISFLELANPSTLVQTTF